MLKESQIAFLNKRKLLIRLWPWVGTALLVLILFFWGYLFFENPLLVNPYHVFERIQDNSLPETTLTLLAVLTPTAFLTCGFLVLTIILFLLALMANERKLLDIIDNLCRLNEMKS